MRDGESLEVCGWRSGGDISWKGEEERGIASQWGQTPHHHDMNKMLARRMIVQCDPNWFRFRRIKCYISSLFECGVWSALRWHCLACSSPAATAIDAIMHKHIVNVLTARMLRVAGVGWWVWIVVDPLCR